MILSFIAAIIFQGCVKDKFDFDKLSSEVEWSPSIAVPLIHSKLTIRDIVRDYDEDDLIEEAQTGFLSLVYNKQVYSSKASDVITLQNQSYNEAFESTEVDISVLQVGMSVTLDEQVVNDFNVGTDEEIDSLILKNGNLEITTSSDFLHTGELVVTFPYVKKNGIAYSKTITIDQDNGTYSSNSSDDMSGYTIDLTNGGSEFNKFPIDYSLTMTNSGNPVSGSEQVSITIKLVDPHFSSFFGYFGSKTLNINRDTLHIEMFNSALEGSAYFENPQLTVETRNSYGLPIKIGLTELGTYSPANDLSVQLYGIGVPSATDPELINSPILSQIGQIITDSLATIDKNNSNLPEVIGNTPKYMFFGIHAETNSEGVTHNNFVTDSSQFDVDVELRLPLKGRASYWALQDTTDINFNEFIDDIDNIEQVLFRFNFTNGMPTDISFQVYFADSLNNIVDSLFTPENTQLITSAKTNGEGEVTESTNKLTDVIYPNERIKELGDVKYIYYSGRVATSDAATKNVSLYSHQELEVKMGVKIDAKINSSEL